MIPIFWSISVESYNIEITFLHNACKGNFTNLCGASEEASVNKVSFDPQHAFHLFRLFDILFPFFAFSRWRSRNAWTRSSPSSCPFSLKRFVASRLIMCKNLFYQKMFVLLAAPTASCHGGGEGQASLHVRIKRHNWSKYGGKWKIAPLIST